MAIRHNAIKNSLDVGKASEWNDDHVINFADRIEICMDFLNEALVDHFDLTQETSSTPSAITLVGSVAAARLNATGGVGNLSAIRMMMAGAAGNVTNIDQLPIMNMAVELGGLTADNKTHQFGLTDSADTPFAVNDDGAFFRVDNNVLYAVTSDGATETTTDLGAPNQFGVYKIVCNSGSVDFYVDDMAVIAAHHTSNLPVADVTMKFSTAQRAGGSNTMSVQGFALSVLREQ